ncbi:3-oxoacyl-ACP reductase FabG [Brevibacillus marinus]|uniref:3-oxoacyl-ACP reductase FabG n=1 Tax=Brevibacillus marinus TaxID=2496837 RepID=UPI000F81C07C|nr:3-oxoacyl-ACP reductase FabG [Brevibacillus marinus]
MKLAQKVALITGAGSGIGRETAVLFAREGASVVVADTNQSTGEEVVKQISEEGGQAIFSQVDTSDQASVRQMVRHAVSYFGSIDILINNAGITQDAMLGKLTAEMWRQVIDVNLSGVFYCTQEVVPYMIGAGKGKIINTSSIVGVFGNIGQTNYAASKAGVIGMTKTWAKELGRKGINVNAVAPGFILTSMVEKMPEKIISQMVERVPLKRMGKPIDVAKTYLFLASDDADYINGTVIHVDGGLVI